MTFGSKEELERRLAAHDADCQRQQVTPDGRCQPPGHPMAPLPATSAPAVNAAAVTSAPNGGATAAAATTGTAAGGIAAATAAATAGTAATAAGATMGTAAATTGIASATTGIAAGAATVPQPPLRPPRASLQVPPRAPQPPLQPPRASLQVPRRRSRHELLLSLPAAETSDAAFQLLQHRRPAAELRHSRSRTPVERFRAQSVFAAGRARGAALHGPERVRSRSRSSRSLV